MAIRTVDKLTAGSGKSVSVGVGGGGSVGGGARGRAANGGGGDDDSESVRSSEMNHSYYRYLLMHALSWFPSLIMNASTMCHF